MNLSLCRGPDAFGCAYAFMLEHDAHASGSVDRALTRAMVRLCPQTVEYLYGTFTPLDVLYEERSWPRLEDVVSRIVLSAAGPEEAVSCIVKYTRSLGGHAEQDLHKMRVGGTEEQIIARGSDWCTDVARVACVLCQVAGIPCRMVYLFDLAQAYSGHAIVEAYRSEMWGAADPSTGVVYHKSGGEPATVWELMNDVNLVEAHAGPGASYTRPGQFRAAGMANYFCWERDRYDYAVTGLNDYYLSILKMSNRGWPGGLRWLYGEGEKARRERLGAD